MKTAWFKENLFNSSSDNFDLKMKAFITLLFLISLMAASSAQEINGMEFLFWKMNKDSVEKVLIENKNNLSEATALDANFCYQGMNTWLYYNIENKLIKVHQRKTFSIIQNKEAEVFYDTIQANLIKNYGAPNQYKVAKKDSLITMTWELKYTKIILEYDYKYKIIDEFGADSYWVDVLFEPVKAD